MALIDSLISYWKLDEASGNALDAHGSNDLTDNNTVGTGTGIISNGRDFESTNSESFSIADGSQAGLDFANEDFSIACWVNGEGFNPGGFVDQYIFSKGAANDAGYLLWWAWGTDVFRFSVGNGSFSSATVSASNLGSPADGTWYFIVCRHDATANTITICVNDGTPNSSSWSSGCADNAAAFRLGATSAGASFFDGIIDEVGIWGKVLSSSEITELYNSGAGLAYPFAAGGGASLPRPLIIDQAVRHASTW